MLPIASIIAEILILLSDPLARTITLFGWSILASTFGEGMLALTLVASYVAASTYRPEPGVSSQRTETQRLSLIPAFFTPIILVYPTSIVPLAGFVSSLLVEWLQALIALSKVKVRIPYEEANVIYGEETEIPVKVETPARPVYYILTVDQVEREKGFIDREATIQVSIRPKRIGLETHSIKILLIDWKKRASRSKGPFNIRLRVNLGSYKAVTRIRRLLKLYGELIGRPRLYRIIEHRPLAESAGQGLGIGSTGVGAGETGKQGPGAQPSAESQTREGVIARGGSTTPSNLVAIALSGVEEGYGARKSGIGEYSGVREYVGGDKPTLIHWKKSVSKKRLFVKQYEEGVKGVGGGGKTLVIADWVSRNPDELDELVKRTYSAVIMGSKRKFLLVRTPKGTLYLVHGGVPEVLAGLDEIVRREGILQNLSYAGWRQHPENNALREMDNYGGKFSELARYHYSMAQALYETLRKLGVESGTDLTLIHSDATFLRNLAIREVFSSGGLRETTIPRESIEEALSYLKGYLTTYRP